MTEFELESQKDLENQQEIYANHVALISRLLSKYYEMGQRATDTNALVKAMKLAFMKFQAEYDKKAMAIEAFEAKAKLMLPQESQDLINEVNAMHTKLIHEMRTPQISALFDSFLK